MQGTGADLPNAPPASANAHALAEQAARHSYGRLLAYLAYRWRDIAAAEDALAEAFASALAHWPRTGVPASPDAWLMTAAKRNLLQMHRHTKLTEDPAVTILLGDDAEAAAPESVVFPDERLKLLFVCAHPAIDAAVRTPLMLQTVLGLDAARIASVFLISPASMSQRLVRAKAKIRQAGIRFEEPEASELGPRIQAVLEAIYAAYGLGWDGLAADSADLSGADSLANEALFLADLGATLLPDSAEAFGLLALILLCESRRDARHDPDGSFVPLHRQDCARWDKAAIQRADQILWTAAGMRTPGPFQIEAAIQAAHCHRLFTGSVPWKAIAQLYEQLVRIAPTIGAEVGRAVAMAEAGALASALESLAGLPADVVASYQPFWVAQAHLLAKTGDLAGSTASYQRALGLTSQPAVRRHLQAELQLLLN